jgi:hypothetical protein
LCGIHTTLSLLQICLNSIFCKFSLGFEALTEIQNLLNNSGYDPSIKESLIIDANNHFFTVIPSIHPHVIKDKDEFKSKVREDSLLFFNLFFYFL